MRLYRGKDKYTKKWIVGYYCPCCFGWFPCSPAIVGKTEMDQGCWRPVEVLPETVGQFAGIHDSKKWGDLTEEERECFYFENRSEDGRTIKFYDVERVKHLWKGNPIFEGDIVKGLFLHGRSINAVVTFNDGAFGLEWYRGDVKSFTAFTSICNVIYEVIGNVHDNPELLKDGE